MTRWALVLAVALELVRDASVPDANVLFATLILLAVSGYNFGRVLVFGRHERTSGNVILRPRSGRRIRVAVPALPGRTAPSWRWRLLVAAAAVVSTAGCLWRSARRSRPPRRRRTPIPIAPCTRT